MYFSATRAPVRGLQAAIAAAAAAGILLISAPAASASPIAVAPIAVTPARAPAGNAVEFAGMVPPAGSAAGPGTLGVTVRVTRAPSRPGPDGPADASRAGRARWWVIGGALLIGAAAFIGVAQWQTKPSRRV